MKHAEVLNANKTTLMFLIATMSDKALTKFHNEFMVKSKMEHENMNTSQNPQLQQMAVRRSAFAVIPDAERLDIGSNEVIAVFKHRHQAEDWAKSMWEKFYIIEEVESQHFA